MMMMMMAIILMTVCVCNDHDFFVVGFVLGP